MRVLSGEGPGRVGRLPDGRAIVLEWKTSGPAMQVVTGRGFLLVNSRSREGRILLPHGHYSGVRVASSGRWTLQARAAQ